ncbi:MAG: FAD-dependent oxidoreductase, partial [Clostridiales bacterium]|nr:FAD-dependent oxidoreductase [Clostridiales bacterium]
MFDVVIIGCGIVGAAAAYELSRYRLNIAVIEKENDVSNAVSKANSGIIHAGYDPEPGSLMAKLNVEGAYLASQICKDLDVPYRRCGSLVVAFDERETEILNMLLERGKKNGVPSLEIWDAEKLREQEPNLNKDA